MITSAPSAMILRPLLRRPVSSFDAATFQVSRSMTVLSKQSAEEYKKLNYTKRMKETGRPVSPHVTIYAFPIAAISSITNRVTGVVLSLGAAGLGAIEIVGGNGAALALMQDIGAYGPTVASMAKFSVAFPCVYHYLGGIRHLVWDEKPEFLNNVDVEKTSYALFASSLVIGGALVFV